MDAQGRKKLHRDKFKQEKKRIDSPFVRYNEHDQLVCKVCNVVVKSELLWPAHQVSRKHHEAIDELKAKAAGLNQAKSSKTEPPPKQIMRPRSESQEDLHEKSEPSTAMPKGQSSVLPPNFFDNQETKRQKTESIAGKSGNHGSHSNASIPGKNQVVGPLVSASGPDKSFTVKSVQKSDPKYQDSEDFIQGSPPATDLEAKQGKASLPKGFFDDSDADLRARGIEPVKPDVKDEYKVFEKLIKEDLQEVDDRMEEEEIDTAEMIQEAESVELRTYKERVEMLRRKKLELRASRSAVQNSDIEITQKVSKHDDSSSDDDNNDNFVVDWRSKHL